MFSFFLLTGHFVLAQENYSLEIPLKAVAGEDRNVLVGRQTLFSGSASTFPINEDIDYLWTFDDGSKAEGIEVTHAYKNSGVYRVTFTTSYNGYSDVDEIIVRVDKDIILFVTDESVSEEKFSYLQELVGPQGILLVDMKVETAETDYLTESMLVQKIIDKKDSIAQATNIVVWTNGNVGLNALITASQEMSNDGSLEKFGFGQKNILVLTEVNLTATARLAQNVYNLLTPQSLILVSEEAEEVVSSTLSLEDITLQLKDNNYNFQLIGVHTQRSLNTVRPWNLLSFAVSYMVNNGVALNTIYLILILPVIATIIAFSRQIIGIKAFGMYAPTLVAVSFIATGIKYGLAIFISVLIVGTLGRLVARKIRLMYLPRMAMVLGVVSFAILALFFFGAVFEKTGLISISIFPILIMVIITEKFISAQIELGNKTAFKLVVETLVMAIVCYYLAVWEGMRVLILGYPEVVLFTFLINYIMGKWAGLRLLELYRFRKVIKNVELSEKK